MSVTLVISCYIDYKVMSKFFQLYCIYKYLLCETSQNKITWFFFFFALDQLSLFKNFDFISEEDIGNFLLHILITFRHRMNYINSHFPY